MVAGPIVGFIYLSNHPDLYATNVAQALQQAGASYTSLTGGFHGFVAGIALVGGFSWFFGYLGGQPQLSMRFMAIKDARQAKRGRNVGIAWTLIAYLGALSMGWIGLAIFGPSGLADREFVMPSVLITIFPPVIAAVLITGAIAAMISTADSLLILSATELTENLLKPLIGKTIIKKRTLLFSRIITALLAAIALTIAYVGKTELIYSLVSYVWAGIGGTFSVIILLTLFWKRFHGRAVILTLVSGLSFTIAWITTGMDEKISARLLTFFVALVVAIFSTLVIKPYKK